MSDYETIRALVDELERQRENAAYWFEAHKVATGHLGPVSYPPEMVLFRWDVLDAGRALVSKLERLEVEP